MNAHDRTERSKVGPRAFSLGALLAFAFAMICFFPNPGVPVGASTGLQAGQLLALLAIPVFLLYGLPKRQTLVAILLFAPVLFSGMIATVTGRALDNAVVLNSVVGFGLVLMVLVPAGRMMDKKYLSPVLLGVSLAILLHGLVALYQVYSFSQDVFPLPWLYQNPSFFSPITEDLDLWATYAKRPFGLFPEPSAMGSAMGPWLVLMAGMLLFPMMRGGMTPKTRRLLLFSLVAGVSLIVVSQSGYTLFLFLGLLLVSLPALRRILLGLHRPKNLFAVLAFALLATALVVFATFFVGERANLQENSSWVARSASILWGFTSLAANPQNLLFGVGPGQSFLILQLGESPVPLPIGSSELPFTSVWSAAVLYIQESGVTGALASVVVFAMIVRAISRSSARFAGFSCLVAWLGGVALTTSYLTLLPIWLFLAMLLSWDRVFEPRKTVVQPQREPSEESGARMEDVART